MNIVQALIVGQNGADPPVPCLNQLGDLAIHRARMVKQDRIQRNLGKAALNRYHRNLGVYQPTVGALGVRRGDQDHARYMFLPQQIDVDRGLLGIIVRVTEQQRVVMGKGAVLYGSHQIGEKEIADVEEQQTDYPRVGRAVCAPLGSADT